MILWKHKDRQAVLMTQALGDFGNSGYPEFLFYLIFPLKLSLSIRHLTTLA